MKHLLDELELYFSDSPHCLALTGSGGKTTCMIQLAKHYAEKDMRVLVSTTTKLLLPKDREYGCDTYFLDDKALSYHPAKGERVFYSHVTHKAVAPPLKNLEALLDRYDVMLLEADGSMNLGLKLHQERDPVVPSFVTGTLALVSMSLLGKPFKANCFGSEYYKEDFPEELVTLDTYSRLLEHKQGILKRVQGKSLVLCNQSIEEDLEQYASLSRSISHAYPIWFGDLKKNQLIYRNPS
ncbi:MAG: putative selenium-dependent hydroxylase accessory protein YqeC [Sphaerochaeta sp.]|nr:putative selenium-dependent hydroxylase accessory protein YqeC [Sphaerochaeta sp.]